jgi:hypothetical protein
MWLLSSVLGIGLWLFALLHLAVQLAAKEAGYVIGRRIGARRGKQASAESEAAGFVVTGLLGLLAFVMALSIAFAQARFEDRRSASLEEANAIGTAWLRAHAVGHPRGALIASQLEAYLAIRRAYVVAPADPAEIVRINAEANALQSRIWAELAAITAERTDPVAASLMAALNETFDAATAQRYAFNARLPREVVALLLALSVLTISVVGYQFGLRGSPRRVLSFFLLATWTASLTLIADLSAPRIGDVRSDPTVYDWALQGMGALPPPSPLPPR